MNWAVKLPVETLLGDQALVAVLFTPSVNCRELELLPMTAPCAWNPGKPTTGATPLTVDQSFVPPSKPEMVKGAVEI